VNTSTKPRAPITIAGSAASRTASPPLA
jgi:hypothetical protein